MEYLGDMFDQIEDKFVKKEPTDKTDTLAGQDPGFEDEIEKMIKILKQQDYILALKSKDELYFGAHITKKER